MKKLFSHCGLILALAAFFLLCSGQQKMTSVSAGDIPNWYTKLPQDPNYLFAVNTAVSQDLQLAVDKAATGARAEIGRQMETKISALQKRFEEEVGFGEGPQLLQQFTQASKTIVSTVLAGSKIAEQKPMQEGGMWRAYVLLNYPIGAANEALLNQIKNNENMYTRFRASETFKELEEEVKKYEEWKKQQIGTN